MRLTTDQKQIIKETITSFYEDARVYLFGSRADDAKKGGDIDLYLKLPQKPHFLDKPKLLVELKHRLGERKIDLIFDYPQKKHTLIDEEALEKGVLL